MTCVAEAFIFVDMFASPPMHRIVIAVPFTEIELQQNLVE